MHVNNFKPESFLWILKECDVPYVPKEWDRLLGKYGKDSSSLTSMSIMGRYLGLMRLKQFKDYRWEHNEFLLELEKKKMEETMKLQGYDAVDIARAVNDATAINFGKAEMGMVASYEYDGDSDVLLINPQGLKPSEEEPDDYFARQSGADKDDFVSDLTEEDRTYLRLKWGKSYKPEDWIKLEQLYEEMMASYDIQGAGHIDTLKLICKTSLKANQLIDLGDVEGYQKMSKVYNDLMKSGKFDFGL